MELKDIFGKLVSGRRPEFYPQHRLRQARERMRLVRNAFKYADPDDLSPEKLAALLKTTVEQAPDLIRSLAARKPDPPPPRIYPKPGTVPDRHNPRPDQDEYAFTPFAPTYKDRQKIFLEHCAQKHAGTLPGAIAAVRLDRPFELPDEEIQAYATRLDQRYDCADFFAVHVVLALYVHEKKPFLSDHHYELLRNALLGFKFWINEPGFCRMIYWSENHQILFHSVEYLAGQMFPGEIFTNNGENGKWHRDHARGPLLRWIKRRAGWGFSEWCSNEYYEKDLESLVLLAEYAEDPDVARAAEMGANLLLLDVAGDLFYGYQAGTHGRSYEDEILSGRDFEMAPACKLVWGMGAFGDHGLMAALQLAAAERYAPPDIIIRIGQDAPEEFSAMDRHGLGLDEVADHGLDTTNIDDAVTLWGMGAYTNPETLDLLIRAADEWRLWKHPFLDFAGDLHKLLPRHGRLGLMLRGIEFEANRALLGRVNKATFRTPDYALSTAQDYRPGQTGCQHQIWQATLGPDAVVFTTNPGSFGCWDIASSPDLLRFAPQAPGSPREEQPSWNRTPTYWAGQNRLPRCAQYKNVVFVLYDIDMRRAVGERGVYAFTHAFFPRWAFDEVFETSGWIFGRRNHGYVALYSEQAIKWKDPDDPFCHDAVARGRKNIWICQLGREAVDGPFRDFRDRILRASLKTDLADLKVRYNAPGLADLKFSWTGPLTADGHEIPLSGYPRMQNNHCRSEFDSGVYTVEHGGERLTLDFPNRASKLETIP